MKTWKLPKHPSLATVVLPVATLFTVVAPTSAQHAVTRVSVDSAGAEGNDRSGDISAASLSDDGRYVAFGSAASNLVSGDTNGDYDVFVRDRDPDGNGAFDEGNGVTTRVSVGSSGVEGNGQSFLPSISGDGRFVAFASKASNLVNGDRNGKSDVFVHDRSNATTMRMSFDSSGHGGNDDSSSPAISSDGAFVAFQSIANNLVAGDTNAAADVFVRDRINKITTRVSVDSTGAEGNGDTYYYSMPSISADGQLVAFTSYASNLVAGDTNGTWDVFVHDRATGLTERVSVDSLGTEANSDSGNYGVSISADGQIVAFSSYASNLVQGDSNGTWDVFVRDRAAGLTECVTVDSSGTEGNGASIEPSIAADGQLVVFASSASNFVAGDSSQFADVFLRDRTAGTTTLLSANCTGTSGDDYSFLPSISGDGLQVAFTSPATNLVPGDTNLTHDVFNFDRTVVEPTAAWSNYGAGFQGTLGIPNLVASADPVFDTTIQLDLDNSSGFFTVGFLLLGFDDASSPTNDGGTILVDWSVIIPLAVWPAGFSLPVDIPRDPELCGVSAYFQGIEVDAGAQFGLSFTPGLALVIGH